MKKTRKVSFDFDDTLSKRRAQSFAKALIARGVEVWIVTSRYSDLRRGGWDQKGYNDDLWEVADRLGIPSNRVVFTDQKPKADFFLGSDFVWHLDDDPVELEEINEQTSVPAIDVKGSFWINKCVELL